MSKISKILTTILIASSLISFLLSPIKVNFRDFKNLTAVAKNWGSLNYKKWVENDINETQKKALQKYTEKDSIQINHYLRKEKGILLKDQIAPRNIEQLNKNIKLIDTALKLVKTPESLILYRRINAEYFLLKDTELRNEQNIINAELVEQIKTLNLGKKIKQYAFISTSLTSHTPTVFGPDCFPIMLKIKVPSGTHAAFLGDFSHINEELEMLIARNYNFEYDKFSIIKDGIHEVLKVNTSLSQD